MDFHSGKVCVRSEDVVDDFCFLLVSLCSNFTAGCVKRLQVGQCQHWVTQEVTIIKVPDVCWASVFL